MARGLNAMGVASTEGDIEDTVYGGSAELACCSGADFCRLRVRLSFGLRPLKGEYTRVIKLKIKS